MPISRIKTIIIMIAFMPVLFSCSATGSIGISNHFLKGKNENWAMEGGGISRNAFRNESINPPLKLVWKTDGSSAFTKTIVVSDSIIYAATKDARVHAYNLRNGKSIGKMKFSYSAMHGPAVNHKDIIIALAMGKASLIHYDVYEKKYHFIKTLGPIENNPLIYDDFIYAATEKGVLHCMDYKDGNLNWSYALPKTSRSSPALYLNAVIIADDGGTVVSLNRFRGSLNWKVNLGSAVFHAPVIDSQNVYIAAKDGRITRIDAETGGIRWTRRLEPDGDCEVFAAPSASNGYVIIGSTNGKVYALRQSDGSTRWTFMTRGAVSVTPVITKEYVYIASQDGFLYAVNLITGVEEWNYKASGRIKTHPAVYGRYLIVAAENKTLYVFQSAGKQ